MKQQITTLLILMNLTLLFGQEKTNTPLIHVKHGDKIGFINFEGREVIPVEFDAVKWFSEDIMAVNKGAIEEDYEAIGGKWGFWNREGEEIIPLKYEDVKAFQEGLAPVKLNGKYGFIDIDDNVQIELQYEDARPFKGGLAAVKIGDQWGFINKIGDLIAPPSFHRVEDFNNSFSIVFHLRETYEYEDDGDIYEDEYGKYGLIDTFGSLRLDTIYDYISEFKNGFARIELDRKEGFIDSEGEISIPIQFDEVEDFSDGLAVVANYMMRGSNYDFGYSKKQIDSLELKAKNILKTMGDNYSAIMYHPTFQEYQMATMQEPSEKLTYGYINERGEIVIDLQFDRAESFENGLAVVANHMVRDSYHDFGYSKKQIDSLQQEVENLYNTIGNTPDAMANHPTFQEYQAAKMQEPTEELMHGYIDKKGNVVIDFQFDSAESFENGLAQVRFGRESLIRVNLVDEDGNRAPSYQELIGIGENLIDEDGNLQLDKNQQIINRYPGDFIVTYNYKGAGAITENFEEVMANQYANLSYLGYGYFAADLQDSERKKILGNGIELDLDENFRRIEAAFGNRFLVDYIVGGEGRKTITKSGIINEKGEWILKPKYDFSYVRFK